MFKCIYSGIRIYKYISVFNDIQIHKYAYEYSNTDLLFVPGIVYTISAKSLKTEK